VQPVPHPVEVRGRGLARFCLTGAPSQNRLVAKDLPAPVIAFIREAIDSVEQLEVLLLLEASPEQSWTIPGIYEKLRSNPESIRLRLERLLAQGLVRQEQTGQFRYAAPTPELAQTIRDLARAYAERRVTIIETIFAKPPSPIQSFADAFRLRKDEKHG
jgi:hypothetical protein